MLTDAHCHPFDLSRVFPEAEQERRRLGILVAASACDLQEFSYNEGLAHKAAEENSAPLFPCFAVHPQMPAVLNAQCVPYSPLPNTYSLLLEKLDRLAAEKRLAAVGECGFDLYNGAFRETETAQEEIFAAHLDTALRYDLPLILHVRRAMHKIFTRTKELAKCKAVVFHSWPGTLEEAQSLLRRGVNAYFSFGNTIRNGHKQAIRCCAALPAERLLTETDSPYQPARGKKFSQWKDLQQILEAAAALRNTSPPELEARIEKNFLKIFTHRET